MIRYAERAERGARRVAGVAATPRRRKPSYGTMPGERPAMHREPRRLFVRRQERPQLSRPAHQGSNPCRRRRREQTAFHLTKDLWLPSRATDAKPAGDDARALQPHPTCARRVPRGRSGAIRPLHHADRAACRRTSRPDNPTARTRLQRRLHVGTKTARSEYTLTSSDGSYRAWGQSQGSPSSDHLASQPKRVGDCNAAGSNPLQGKSRSAQFPYLAYWAGFASNFVLQPFEQK